MPGEWIVEKEGRKARVFTRALQKAAPQTRRATVRTGNGPAGPLILLPKQLLSVAILNPISMTKNLLSPERSCGVPVPIALKYLPALLLLWLCLPGRAQTGLQNGLVACHRRSAA
jgi:hypothetical protein